jgi:hypothetical protein
MKAVAPTSVLLKTTRVRHSVLAMIFIVSTLNYASRATLSIAGTAASKQLGINAVQLGYLFSAFGWAYVIAQIPGGWLMDRFGSKNVYALSILTWSVFTFLQGFAGAFHATMALAVFFALRFLLGLAEAPAFPGNGRIVASYRGARHSVGGLQLQPVFRHFPVCPSLRLDYTRIRLDLGILRYGRHRHRHGCDLDESRLQPHQPPARECHRTEFH